MGKEQKLRQMQRMREAQAGQISLENPVEKAIKEARVVCEERYDCLSIVEVIEKSIARLIVGTSKDKEAATASLNFIGEYVKGSGLLTKSLLPDRGDIQTAYRRFAQLSLKIDRGVETLESMGVTVPKESLMVNSYGARCLVEITRSTGVTGNPIVKIPGNIDSVDVGINRREVLEAHSRIISIISRLYVSWDQSHLAAPEQILAIAKEASKTPAEGVADLYTTRLSSGVSLQDVFEGSKNRMEFYRNALEFLSALPKGDLLWMEAAKAIFFVHSFKTPTHHGRSLHYQEFFRDPEVFARVLNFNLALSATLVSGIVKRAYQKQISDELLLGYLEKLPKPIIEEIASIAVEGQVSTGITTIRLNSSEPDLYMAIARIPLAAEALDFFPGNTYIPGGYAISCLTLVNLERKRAALTEGLLKRGYPKEFIDTLERIMNSTMIGFAPDRFSRGYAKLVNSDQAEFIEIFKKEDLRIAELINKLNSAEIKGDKGKELSQLEAREGSLAKRLQVYVASLGFDRYEDKFCFIGNNEVEIWSLAYLDDNLKIIENRFEANFKPYPGLLSIFKLMILSLAHRTFGEDGSENFKMAGRILDAIFNQPFSSVERIIKSAEFEASSKRAEKESASPEEKRVQSLKPSPDQEMAELLEMIRRGI